MGYTCGPDQCWIDFWEMENSHVVQDSERDRESQNSPNELRLLLLVVATSQGSPNCQVPISAPVVLVMCQKGIAPGSLRHVRSEF